MFYEFHLYQGMYSKQGPTYLNCDEEISEKKIIAAKYATYAVAKMVIILSG